MGHWLVDPLALLNWEFDICGRQRNVFTIESTAMTSLWVWHSSLQGAIWQLWWCCNFSQVSSSRQLLNLSKTLAYSRISAKPRQLLSSDAVVVFKVLCVINTDIKEHLLHIYITWKCQSQLNSDFASIPSLLSSGGHEQPSARSNGHESSSHLC